MPITPYTQPIQFEYKPLNLAAFAVPLAQMQEKFDVTQALVNESDVDLSHLSFGTDPIKAEELKQTYREKRDELAKNLAETGNYTQAATKLKNLNKLWQTDPNRKSLEYNYALRQKYMEEQQKRIDSGKADQITRDQYYQDIARKDREYESGEGTNWQYDPNVEKGKYNTYGTKARLSDLEKEFEDMTWKVANAVEPDKIAGALIELGVDPSLMDKKFMQTITEARSAGKVANAVSGYLKTLPRFKEWALEKADYDYEALKATNPEGYAKKTEELTSNALKSINGQLGEIEAASKTKAGKGLLESNEYKQLLDYKNEIEESKAKGEFDEPLIQGLYNQEALNKMYDMRALGKVFEYKKIDRDYTFKDLYIPPKGKGSGSGDAEDPLSIPGSYAPTTNDPLNMNNLVTQRVTNAKSLIPSITNMVNIADGNMRTLTQGLPNTEYRKNIQKNPGLQREKLNKIYTIAADVLAKGGNATDFQRNLWNAGIREGNNSKSAAAVFSSLSGNKGNTLNYMREQLESSEGAFSNWNDAKSQEKAINDRVTEIPEFKNYLGKLGTENININNSDIISLGKQLGIKKTNLNDIITELNKKGVKINELETAEGYSSFTTSINNFSKSKGYKSLDDAIKNGANFGVLNFGYGINRSLDKEINDEKQRLIDTKLRGEFMSFRYVGDKKVDDYLNAQFLSAGDLSSFHPATKPDFKGIKGFDEDGGLLPGTQLMLTDKQAVKIVKKGNRMLLEVPYKYNNDDQGKGETSVLLEFKKGQDPLQQKLLSHINYLTSGSKESDALSKQTYNTTKAMQYDVTYKSDLTQLNFDLADVDSKSKPVILETVPTGEPGTNVEIVKQYVEGRPPQIFVRTNNGTKTAYLTKNGKNFSTNSVDEAKVFIAENLIGE